MVKIDRDLLENGVSILFRKMFPRQSFLPGEDLWIDERVKREKTRNLIDILNNVVVFNGDGGSSTYYLGVSKSNLRKIVVSLTEESPKFVLGGLNPDFLGANIYLLPRQLFDVEHRIARRLPIENEYVFSMAPREIDNLLDYDEGLSNEVDTREPRLVVYRSRGVILVSGIELLYRRFEWFTEEERVRVVRVVNTIMEILYEVLKRELNENNYIYPYGVFTGDFEKNRQVSDALIQLLSPVKTLYKEAIDSYNASVSALKERAEMLVDSDLIKDILAIFNYQEVENVEVFDNNLFIWLNNVIYPNKITKNGSLIEVDSLQFGVEGIKIPLKINKNKSILAVVQGDTHPHVAPDGKICLGDLEGKIASLGAIKFLADRDNFESFLSMLEIVNLSSAYGNEATSICEDIFDEFTGETVAMFSVYRSFTTNSEEEEE